MKQRLSLQGENRNSFEGIIRFVVFEEAFSVSHPMFNVIIINYLLSYRYAMLISTK